MIDSASQPGAVLAATRARAPSDNPSPPPTFWTPLLRDAIGPPTAAVIGKYISSTAIASAITSGASIINFADPFNNHFDWFRMSGYFFSRAGAADPTTVMRCSLYDVTLAPFTGATGLAVTLGSEVDGSAFLPSLTPRGTYLAAGGGDFQVPDKTKTYAMVTELSGANLPASVAIPGTITLFGKPGVLF